MVAVTVSGITIEMKHVFSNNGSLYYQRAIPKALQERLGRRTFKIKLDPMLGNVSIQATKLAAQHDALFKAMQHNQELTFSEQKLAALATLATYGLSPNDGNADGYIEDPRFEGLQPWIDPFMDEYLDKQREGLTTKEEDLAYKMLFKPLPLTLSEALDTYFSSHERGNEYKWRKNIQHYWSLFMDHAGDVALISVSRDDVKAYIQKRLNAGKKTGTVEKELAIISAVFNKARIEKSINCINPFERQRIPNSGKDVKKKLVLSKEELQAVVNAAIAKNDDIRTIVLLQAATGARISEVVGLRVEDVTNLNAITYLKLQTHNDEHGERRLKNANSSREVPLVSFAKAAAVQLAKDAKSKWLFPRYISETGEVLGTHASNTVNKWLNQQVSGLTSHSFRHTLKTYLREVTTKALNDEITGHASGDTADQYGLGVSLKMKLDALNKALKEIDA
jgi:integrase